MRIVRVSKSVCAKASGSMNDLRSYKYRVWILCLDCAVRARDASAQIAAFIMVLALLYKKQHFSMVGTRFTQFTVKSSNKSNSQNDKMSALPEITCYTFFVGYDVWIDEHFCVVPKINEKVRLPWPFHDCDSFAEIHCSKMSKYRGGGYWGHEFKILIFYRFLYYIFCRGDRIPGPALSSLLRLGHDFYKI